MAEADRRRGNRRGQGVGSDRHKGNRRGQGPDRIVV